MRDALTTTAELDALATIGAFVRAGLEHAGFDERGSWQVQLAVDEAATNIIQHAYPAASSGAIEVIWWFDDTTFGVELRDTGQPFDPAAVPRPQIDAPLEERGGGGLGLYLIDQLMDTVAFAREAPGVNVVRMSRRRPSRAPAVRQFALHGRLDARHSTAALAPVRAALDDGARAVLLDLSDVSFISSSGLRDLIVLLRRVRAVGGELRLCALQPLVAEVFALTGFVQLFPIHPTAADGLRACGGPTHES
jgi:anti-anti-sigma factor